MLEISLSTALPYLLVSRLLTSPLHKTSAVKERGCRQKISPQCTNRNKPSPFAVPQPCTQLPVGAALFSENLTINRRELRLMPLQLEPSTKWR